MSEFRQFRQQNQVFNELWTGFRSDSAITTGPKRENLNSVLVNLNIPVLEPVLSEIQAVIDDLNRSAPGHRPEKEHHLTMRAIADLTQPFDESRLREWTDTANEAIQQYSPFEVTVRGVSTFSNVAFAGVYVPPEFWQLHMKLLETLPSRRREWEGRGMVPHLGLVYYQHPPDDLIPHLAKLRGHKFGNFKVERFELEGRSIGENANQHHHFSTINFR